MALADCFGRRRPVDNFTTHKDRRKAPLGGTKVRVDTAPVNAVSLTVEPLGIAAGSSSGHHVRSEPKGPFAMSAYVLSCDHNAFECLRAIDLP